MSTITAKAAGTKLSELINSAALSHEPVLITDKRGNGVLLSEDDWRSVQETLYLLSIPGMRESIRKGLKTPVSQCETSLKW